MVGDGVLDDLQQLFLRIHRSNGESMQQLHHETGEPLEGSGDTNGRADLDQYAFGGVDKDLQFSRLVDRRVKQSEKTLHVEVSSSLPFHSSGRCSHLMGYVWSGITDVAAHFAHDTDVLIAVQQ